MRSDALVLFGVSGDLAHKMIFPSLYALARRDALKVPVIGVASSPRTLARLRMRAADGIKRSGGIDDRRALRDLLFRIQYGEGDDKDPETFADIKKALPKPRRLAHDLLPERREA